MLSRLRSLTVLINYIKRVSNIDTISFRFRFILTQFSQHLGPTSLSAYTKFRQDDFQSHYTAVNVTVGRGTICQFIICATLRYMYPHTCCFWLQQLSTVETWQLCPGRAMPAYMLPKKTTLMMYRARYVIY